MFSKVKEYFNAKNYFPYIFRTRNLVLVLFLFNFSILASSQKEEAFNVLQSAVEINRKTNFKAEFTVPSKNKGSELHGITTQKVNPDGTVWSKTEIKGKGVNLTTLQNDEGSFTIIGNRAIKNAIAPGIQNVQTSSRENEVTAEALEQFDIKMSKKFINGKNCYVITFGKPSSLIKNDKTVAITEYTIDVENKFIYSTNMYNRNGELISSLNYSTVDTNPILNDQMFEVPKNVTVTVATDKKKFVKATLEATNAATPPPQSKAIKK